MARLQNTNVVSETVNVLGLGDAEELSQHSSDGEDSDSDSDSESEDEDEEENVQEVEVESKNVLYTIQPTPVLEEISEEKIVVEKLGQDEPEAEEEQEEVTIDVEPEMLQQDRCRKVEQEIENYEKMTIKELKEIISQRNIPLKKHVKERNG